MRVGRERMLDAERALHNVLRLPQMRSLFLKFALETAPDGKAERLRAAAAQAAAAEADEDEDDAESKEKASGKSNLPLTVEQNVQLILHSENVLADRDHYLRLACSLWAELDVISKAGRSSAALVGLSRKFVSAERGGKRAGSLWKGLRSAIYDPLDAGDQGQDPEVLWRVASEPTSLLYAIEPDRDPGALGSVMRGSTPPTKRRFGGLRAKSVDGVGGRLRAAARKVSEPTTTTANVGPLGAGKAVLTLAGAASAVTSKTERRDPFKKSFQIVESQPLSAMAGLGSAFDDLEADQLSEGGKSSKSGKWGMGASSEGSSEENTAQMMAELDQALATNVQSEHVRDICMLQHVPAPCLRHRGAAVLSALRGGALRHGERAAPGATLAQGAARRAQPRGRLRRQLAARRHGRVGGRLCSRRAILATRGAAMRHEPPRRTDRVRQLGV